MNHDDVGTSVTVVKAVGTTSRGDDSREEIIAVAIDQSIAILIGVEEHVDVGDALITTVLGPVTVPVVVEATAERKATTAVETEGVGTTAAPRNNEARSNLIIDGTIALGRSNPASRTTRESRR